MEVDDALVGDQARIRRFRSPSRTLTTVQQFTKGAQPVFTPFRLGLPAFFSVVRCDARGATRAAPFDPDRVQDDVGRARTPAWRAGRPAATTSDAFVRYIMSVGGFISPLFLAPCSSLFCSVAAGAAASSDAPASLSSGRRAPPPACSRALSSRASVKPGAPARLSLRWGASFYFSSARLPPSHLRSPRVCGPSRSATRVPTRRFTRGTPCSEPGASRSSWVWTLFAPWFEAIRQLCFVCRRSPNTTPAAFSRRRAREH